jgi:hypothetical protein
VNSPRRPHVLLEVALEVHPLCADDGEVLGERRYVALQRLAFAGQRAQTRQHEAGRDRASDGEDRE